MAKRFCDTELWQKEWFQDLNLKEKILVKYIFENCDCAGVWNGNFKLASFIIGEKVSLQDLEIINDRKLLFEILSDGKIFITDFIKFQYGELSEKCKPHQKIISLLKNYNLFERVSKGYAKGIHTLEEKEEEKEKDKDKDKDKEKEKEDIFISSDIEKTFQIYKETCPNLCKLTFERRNMDLRRKIEDFLFEIRGDMEYFTEVCQKANKIKFIADCKIDFKSLINNHIGIMNGKYEPPPDEREEAIKRFMENY